ncbi:MAG: hypothetical protein Q4C54_00390 [Clostridia bacterium]|nr:hypothetical protein [Clostridia bacterium]
MKNQPEMTKKQRKDRHAGKRVHNQSYTNFLMNIQTLVQQGIQEQYSLKEKPDD